MVVLLVRSTCILSCLGGLGYLSCQNRFSSCILRIFLCFVLENIYFYFLCEERIWISIISEISYCDYQEHGYSLKYVDRCNCLLVYELDAFLCLICSLLLDTVVILFMILCLHAYPCALEFQSCTNLLVCVLSQLSEYWTWR
jgi:hypothetical protein